MRDEWRSLKSRNDVLAAARRQLEFNQGRLEFWQNKQEEVMRRIKEDGIEIDESVAAGYTNSHRGPQVAVRMDYQKDLNETHGKISTYKSEIETYKGWVRFLEELGPNELALTINDYLFFFKGAGMLAGSSNDGDR